MPIPTPIDAKCQQRSPPREPTPPHHKVKTRQTHVLLAKVSELLKCFKHVSDTQACVLHLHLHLGLRLRLRLCLHLRLRLRLVLHLQQVGMVHNLEHSLGESRGQVTREQVQR